MNAVERSKELLEKYDGKSGIALLQPLIIKEFPGKIALVSSFGTEAAVLLAMVAGIDPALPVIFLDTQKHFPETLAYRDTLVNRLGLTGVRTIYPDYVDTGREDPDGTLWSRNVNACCYIRRVRPLQKALKGYDAWITGRKRFQGGQRTEIAAIEAFEGRVKINPLATWSREEIARAMAGTGLPPHPLAGKGYTSIGCAPCTSIPDNPDDPRGGRWKGTDKDECGIHIGADGRPQRAKA